MPAFKSGRVESILEERAGLQRVLVSLDGNLERAYVLTQLTGPVAIGDSVVVNTTAVDLGLGTGGWHVVHWNLARDHYSAPGPGHIMKARYTSLQTDVGSTEEHWAELADVTSIDGMPVVAAALHSQVPAIAAAFKQRRPDARLAYVMTDGAALPLALSDLVAQLRERSLLDATITCGHAFGGDYEAVSVYSALAVARHIAMRTRRSWRWGRGSWAPRPGSGSVASKWGRCSTPPRSRRGARSRACGCRSPIPANGTAGSRTTARPRSRSRRGDAR